MRKACSSTTRRRKTRMLRRRRPPSNLCPRRPKRRKARPRRKRRRLSPPNAKTRLDMTLEDRALKICNCNKTIALDAKALGAALKLTQPIQMHTELGRKEVGSFQESLKDEACVVACTQEAPLFSEIAQTANSPTQLKFINIREHAGWSKEGAQATPKIAALLSLAELPEPESVPVVNYQSGGQLLVIGPAEAAIAWADKLAEQLDVNVLVTRGKGGELPAERRYPVWSGKVTSLKGHLGEFEVVWEQDNPIDLEVCTRCNACIHACPEQAIDFSYQIDMDKCKAHRECVKACGAIRAIDFERAERARNERFDMVLDLSAQPLLEGRLQPVPRRVLDRRHHGGRRSRQGRPAPVHGLRRLCDRVPLGGDDLRLSSRAGLRRAAEARAFGLRPGGRQGRLPAPAQCGREPRAYREARAARERPARARDSARSPSSRLDRNRRAAGGARLWRMPGAGARSAEGSRRIRRRNQTPDGLCRDDRHRARLRRDAFPAHRDGRARGAGEGDLGACSRGIGGQAGGL